MDLIKLFSPAYLFDAFPGSEFGLRWLVYGFFVLMLTAGILLPKWLKERPQAKIEAEFFGGIPYRLREFAALGFLFTFFRDQNVPYFGMRVWMLVVVAGLLVYLIYTWRNYQKNFALRLAAKSEKKVEDKYKPKKKRRK